MQNYPRSAGTLVPVFSLRRTGDFGIGDTEALLETIVFCAEQKMGLLQVLPVNETGDDSSPYNAISSVALDPVYLTLDPSIVPGLTDEILQELAPESLLESLRAGPVRYREVKKLKLEILSHAFVNFEADEWDQETEFARQFKSFLEDNSPWLEGYTMFRTLLNEYEGNAVWTNWAPEHQSMEATLAWLENYSERDEFERYRLFTSYLQWICWRQWYGVRKFADKNGVRLIGDIPFGISRFSADVWAERGLFDLDWSGGAPPEPAYVGDKFLNQWGQNWGIPLYNWAAHEDQDYTWWRQRVQQTGLIFHGFRIDHVLGFFRIWSFPWMPQQNQEFIDLNLAEVELKTGGVVPQFIPHPDAPPESAVKNALHGEELLRILKDVAGDTAIIAEDLGMVPPYVPVVLEKLEIPGFDIPHFIRVPKTEEYVAYDEIKELRVVSWGTHDHAPLRAWYNEIATKWKGPNGHEPWLELQRLMRFIGWDENHPPEAFNPQLHKALLESVLKSKATWAILTICDILDLNLRFNLPGTASDENWSQRLDRPLADYATDPEYGDKLANWRDLVTCTNRAEE